MATNLQLKDIKAIIASRLYAYHPVHCASIGLYEKASSVILVKATFKQFIAQRGMCVTKSRGGRKGQRKEVLTQQGGRW